MTESTLTQAQADKQAKARAAFVAACWKGTPAADLLPLAESAGMNATQADTLAGEISKAREDKALADTLPGLRREATKARTDLEKVKAESEAAIAQLEDAIEAAAITADIAKRAVYAADDAAQRVRMLADRGDVPTDYLPREVMAIREREAAEREKNAIHRRWVEATNAVANIRGAINDAETTLENMKAGHIGAMCLGGVSHTPDSLKSCLVRYRKDLSSAGETLRQAAAAARSAGFEIP